MRSLIAGSIAITLALTVAACSQPAAEPSGQSASTSTTPPVTAGTPVVAEQRTIATGLQSPWGMAFLPDGSALVTERDTGTIKRVVAQATGPGQVTTVGKVPAVAHTDGGEEGLLGIALAPGPAPTKAFVYFTTARDNRIATMSWDGQRLGAPQPILTGIPANTYHNGGRLAFGPDGYLYAGTGDAGERERAQQRSNLGGKILRITTAGAPAPGNPFPGSTVWTLGHRNVQGLAFDSRGRLWASEFGEKTHDELNLIEAGSNYGWPIHEGKANDPAYADPYVQWPTADASPSGLAIINNWAYLAALRGERLWQVGIANPQPIGPNELFFEKYGRLRTPVPAPDGTLWVSTSNTDGRANPSRLDDRIIAFTVSAPAP